MNVHAYLTRHQPTVLKNFSNALATKKLSHAYLLNGDRGTPLLETAIYFAKSLICDNTTDVLACDKCLTCLRIENRNYLDLILLDGSEGSIKKDDVKLIEDNFNKTSIEAKATMIYIIHLVETMTAEAVNSLLKFLEEPGKNVFAFLTCNNPNRVLPTILSRVQILNFKNIDKFVLKRESLDLGVPIEDAEFLVNFFNDAHLVKTKLEDEDYLNAKKCILLTLNTLDERSQLLLLEVHQKVMPFIKTKESCKFYLDMLMICFEEILNIQVNRKILLENYANILRSLSKKLSNIQFILVEITKAYAKIEMNINLALLVDHVMVEIGKGVEING